MGGRTLHIPYQWGEENGERRRGRGEGGNPQNMKGTGSGKVLGQNSVKFSVSLSNRCKIIHECIRISDFPYSECL